MPDPPGHDCSKHQTYPKQSLPSGLALLMRYRLLLSLLQSEGACLLLRQVGLLLRQRLLLPGLLQGMLFVSGLGDPVFKAGDTVNHLLQGLNAQTVGRVLIRIIGQIALGIPFPSFLKPESVPDKRHKVLINQILKHS